MMWSKNLIISKKQNDSRSKMSSDTSDKGTGGVKPRIVRSNSEEPHLLRHYQRHPSTVQQRPSDAALKYSANKDCSAKAEVRADLRSPVMDLGRPATLGVSSRHKSHSLGSLSDTAESPVIDQEYIFSLTHDVRSFSDALNVLKLVYNEDYENGDLMRAAAMDRLGELLSILKNVLEKYPMLNSNEIFTAARTLINGVKNFDYDDEVGCDYNELYDGIDQLALAFSSSVSECLMGDVETSSPCSNRSRSFESLTSVPLNDCGVDLTRRDSLDLLTPEDINRFLMRLESGVEIALQRAKAWSKYAKDIIGFVEKRCQIEMEFSKSLSKLASTMKPVIRDESYLPFQSVYCLFMDRDVEYSNTCAASLSLIQGQKFIEPLAARKSDHDKIRRGAKETWTKAVRKMQESEVALRKAKQTYDQRYQELDAAKETAIRSDVDPQSQAKLEKRKRLVDEAEVAYRHSVNNANLAREELERVKNAILTQLRDVLNESEEVMKSLAVGYFQLYHKVAAPTPVQYQALAESCQLYEPGTQFCEYVRHLQAELPTEIPNIFVFEPYFNERIRDKYGHSADLDALQKRGRRHHTVSDTESASGGSSKSHESSPSASPNVVMRRRKIPTIGETDEPAMDVDGGSGPFKNIVQSSAARTHVLRKLRTPAKCRECDNYVYFNGAECAKCGLAIHKKCLEACALTCGNKPAQRRLTTFGIDFREQVECTRSEIPPIIVKCIKEVESRGMEQKGVYRVSGVKSRVEKLCQSFEIEGEKVDLAEHHPNVISNVLKLYLRQLPEPLLTFCLYGEFIKCAKESIQTGNSEATVTRLSSIVHLLPQANLRTLAYLIHHLRIVTEHQDVNQMSACNLGIVFGPTLLRPKEGASLNSLVDTEFQTKAVELMINHAEVIFGPYESCLPRSSDSLHPDQTRKIRRKSASMREPGKSEESEPARRKESDHRERVSTTSVGQLDAVTASDKRLKRCVSDDLALAKNTLPVVKIDPPENSPSPAKEKKKLAATSSLDPALLPPHSSNKPKKFGSWTQLTSRTPFAKLTVALGSDDREPKYV